jgi:acetoin utilization protein AcuB
MKVQITETMSKKVFTVPPDMGISEAYEFLLSCRVRHLVVIDGDNHVVGIISDRDFQRAMHSNIEQAGPIQVVSEYFKLDQRVRDFMSANVQFLGEDESLKQAAMKMLETKISSLVVINQSHQMVGFITSDDLLWALVKLIDDNDHDLIQELKAQIMNSPLGTLVNSISQAGI